MKSNSTVWLCIAAFLGFVVFILYGPAQMRYATLYSVNADQVHVADTPHGCDFTDVPLGNKHCHFEHDINLVHADGGISSENDTFKYSSPVVGVNVDWTRVAE